MALGLAALPTAANADPRLDKEQWWFDSWHIQQEVWPQTKGQGVTIGLIDSGVNSQLPEFNGALVASSGKNGDGLKDTDSEGHGTEMAGLIVGRGGRVTGVAPAAKVMPIVNEAIGDVEMAAAIRYAVDHGVKVVNVSQGGGSSSDKDSCPPKTAEAVAYAATKDVVVVASSGNTGDTQNWPEWPASCAGVLAVGGIDHTGRPWANTQRQSYVTVAGPGAGIREMSSDGKLYLGNGTSQAAALISGAIALIRSKYPDMPARKVVQVVTNTTVDVGPKGRDDQTGYGLVSIRRALANANKIPESAPNPVYQRLDKAVAAQKAKDGPSATPQAAGTKDDDGGGSGTLILGVVGLVVLVAIVLVVFLVLRGRKTPRGPQPPSGPSFGPPSGSAYPGPPPSFQQPPSGPPQSGNYPPPGNR
ncbi:S8 family peptidase [Actinomadura parmotrematis]|uniref:S8/S53 family peptidase n=1 Tax=Actinomadura parmotrematis TaxID=2864039 RepID=A0ABS7FYP4_9ACTN|nr:S8 family serine peptidase [Actinomadura parmotrematis]MBW8485260.1 S8/S53 family peptidase [Actinomadura parmotrematis]